MNRQRFLLLVLFLVPVYWCMDGILITSIRIKPDGGVIKCGGVLNLTIDGKSENPQCENGVDQADNKSYVELRYNGTDPVTPLKNISLVLLATVASATNITQKKDETFTGVFLVDEKSTLNKLSIGVVTLDIESLTSTTTKPKLRREEEEEMVYGVELLDADNICDKTDLTINYVHLRYDECKQAVEKNGGAVAVAVIEGIALIAILAYMGYRTMVKHRMKETTMNAAMYGYDNNSRITVPDSIRMSDIPPPRDASYANPPTPTVQQQVPTRNTVMTTQELVVPPTTSAPTISTPTTITTTNSQFRDPFDSLENW